MRAIDVFGPPGVGKTTILRALFAGPHDGIYDAKLSPWRRTKWSPGWAEIWRVSQTSLDRQRPCRRVKKCRGYVRRSLKIAAAVAGRSSRDVALIDGGLCQRGQSLASCGVTDAQLMLFYDAVPFPAGAVVLTAPMEVIAQRNRDRGRDQTEDVAPGLRSIDVALPILSARGTIVCRLDATAPVAENVARIIAFCRDLRS
jgi:hypothetical protein